MASKKDIESQISDLMAGLPAASQSERSKIMRQVAELKKQLKNAKPEPKQPEVQSEPLEDVQDEEEETLVTRVYREEADGGDFLAPNREDD